MDRLLFWSPASVLEIDETLQRRRGVLICIFEYM